MATNRFYPDLTTLRTAAFVVVAMVVTLTFTLCYPLIYAPQKFGMPVLGVYVRTQMLLMRLICGLRLEIQGRENLPEEPCLIASEHQSMWETIAYHTIFANPAILAKESLFKIWFLGPIMRKNGHIVVRREAGADAAVEVLKQARNRIKQGRNVLVFPTGTRAQGANGTLKTGTSLLYRTLKCPVVPVILNSGDMISDRPLRISKGVIRVEILTSIKPGLTNSDFMDVLGNVLSHPERQR